MRTLSRSPMDRLVYPVAALVLASLVAGCLTGGERERPPENLTLNRATPGEWTGRLPAPSETSLGRTRSIKGTQKIDPNRYSLRIFGLVEDEMTLSFEDILEYPYVERDNVMYCVEGWSWSADWRGIAVRDLLQDAGVKPAGKRVIFYAADGYTSSFPVDELMGSDAFIIGYMANGDYLPERSGYPARLIAEGKWGYKWVKWVVQIEVTENEDHRGYWESRGYSDSADVK